MNDSSLGVFSSVTFTLEFLMDVDLHHAGSISCPQPFPLQAIIPAISFCLHSSFNSTLEGPEGL